MAFTFTGTADKAAAFARMTDLPGAVSAASGASLTLTSAQSGNLILLDTASTTVTLPACAAGMSFTFVTTTTASAQKVVTSAATEFLLGGLSLVSAGTSTGAVTFNGTTHRSLTMNGTTAGGIVGSVFTVTCISTTQWVISGVLQASGTAALTPATS